jgi:hypothetical protein
MLIKAKCDECTNIIMVKKHSNAERRTESISGIVRHQVQVSERKKWAAVTTHTSATVQFKQQLTNSVQ